VYEFVDSPGDQATAAKGPTGRHRGRRPMPAPVALALTVTGLVGAFGLGSALLPASLTGPGTPAESPAAAVAALAPGAGGGVPGDGAARPAGPAAFPTPSASPSPTRTASPRKATPTRKPKPRVTTKKTSAPAVAPGLTGQENEVIRLVNVERGKAGCGPVRLNTKLRTAIRLHVAELGTHGNLYISHVSDDGRTFVDRAEAQGYDDPGGENVARGQRDAADVMNSWMNSAGHRANILNCSFKAIGVGVTKGVDGTLVWGQLFGRS
jgi:uncharacterized protein YkwD